MSLFQPRVVFTYVFPRFRCYDLCYDTVLLSLSLPPTPFLFSLLSLLTFLPSFFYFLLLSFSPPHLLSSIATHSQYSTLSPFISRFCPRPLPFIFSLFPYLSPSPSSLPSFSPSHFLAFLSLTRLLSLFNCGSVVCISTT